MELANPMYFTAGAMIGFAAGLVAAALMVESGEERRKIRDWFVIQWELLRTFGLFGFLRKRQGVSEDDLAMMIATLEQAGEVDS